MLNISSQNHDTTFQFRKHAFHRQFKDVYDLVIMNTGTRTLRLVSEVFSRCLNIKLIFKINFIFKKTFQRKTLYWVTCFWSTLYWQRFNFVSYESQHFLRDANSELWGYRLDNYIAKQAWRKKVKKIYARILSEEKDAYQGETVVLVIWCWSVQAWLVLY